MHAYACGQAADPPTHPYKNACMRAGKLHAPIETCMHMCAGKLTTHPPTHTNIPQAQALGPLKNALLCLWHLVGLPSPAQQVALCHRQHKLTKVALCHRQHKLTCTRTHTHTYIHTRAHTPIYTDTHETCCQQIMFASTLLCLHPARPRPPHLPRCTPLGTYLHPPPPPSPRAHFPLPSSCAIHPPPSCPPAPHLCLLPAALPAVAAAAVAAAGQRMALALLQPSCALPVWWPARCRALPPVVQPSEGAVVSHF